MTQGRWTELEKRHRRRELIRTVCIMAASWTLLFGIYYLVPFTDRTSGGSLLRLALGIAGFVLVLAWELRRITRARVPGLRAIQALGITIAVFILLFAIVYLSLSEASSSRFSEPLNHTGALYLTVTVFSTVGFGDITPKGDVTRIVVSIQMLLDLVVIGAVVRLITTAAKTGLGDSGGAASGGTDGRESAQTDE